MESRLYTKKASRILYVVLLILGLLSASASGNIVDSVSSAVGTAAGVATNVTNSVGSAVSGAATNASAAVQNATNAVGSGLNSTVNATRGALQGVAASGASAAATVINSSGIVSAVGGPLAELIEGSIRNGVRHPLVFWPGYGTSRLRVDVAYQDEEPDCPTSGTFHVAFGNPTVLEGWEERCIYKLLEIQYDEDVDDFNSRFSSRPDINVTVADFGYPLCAPIPYEPSYLLLEAAGYTAGKLLQHMDGRDFFVACYDWRVPPFIDVASDGAHLARARGLVEQAYANTGRPVYLAGHSNGGLQALALLNSSSQEWRSKYVAGLIGFAGNWAGQGAIYAPIFTGQSLFDNSNYPAAAPAWESWPSTYMSAADPGIYNSSEVVIQATVDGRRTNYTTADYAALFRDANLTLAQELAPRITGNLSARTAAPKTNFYGFYGSGLQTLVGVTLPNLQQGSAPVDGGTIYALGDDNQEATDNLSPLMWNNSQSTCHFEMIEHRNVGHVTIPLDPSVLVRAIDILYSNPMNCSIGSNSTTTAGR